MKPALMTLVALMVSSPALAHSGGHIHPHGIDAAAALLLVSGALAIATAAAVAVRGRK